MQNSMIMFTFSVLDRKYSFWANLVQKSKIVSLSWNLVPRLTWICRIQWSFSFLFFFSFLDQKYSFWANLVQKFKTVCLKWYLVPRLIRICITQWWCLLLLFYTRNAFFGYIWSKIPKLFVYDEIWSLN